MKLRNRQPRREPRSRAAEVVATPQEQPEFDFDPRKEMTEQDLQDTIAEMMELRGTNWWGYFETASSIIALFPERKDDLQLDQEAWDGMFSEMEPYRDTDLDVFLRMANAIAVVDPEKKAELGITINEITRVKDEMKMYRNLPRKNWWSYYKLATQITKLKPEIKSELELDAESWEGIKEQLYDYRKSSPSLYLNMAAALCMLHPERKQELGLNQETWQGLMQHKHEEESRQGFAKNYLSIIDINLGLAILTADEAHMTNQGLKLTRRSKIGKTPGLPDRKIA